MKNILPFMTSVIVTLAATEIPSYISYEVFLAYIGMGMSDMSLGRLIYESESAMLTPGWQFEFWSPVVVSFYHHDCFYMSLDRTLVMHLIRDTHVEVR